MECFGARRTCPEVEQDDERMRQASKKGCCYLFWCCFVVFCGFRRFAGTTAPGPNDRGQEHARACLPCKPRDTRGSRLSGGPAHGRVQAFHRPPQFPCAVSGYSSYWEQWDSQTSDAAWAGPTSSARKLPAAVSRFFSSVLFRRLVALSPGPLPAPDSWGGGAVRACLLLLCRRSTVAPSAAGPSSFHFLFLLLLVPSFFRLLLASFWLLFVSSSGFPRSFLEATSAPESRCAPSCYFSVGLGPPASPAPLGRQRPMAPAHWRTSALLCASAPLTACSPGNCTRQITSVGWLTACLSSLFLPLGGRDTSRVRSC